jgi:hypothetical protein
LPCPKEDFFERRTISPTSLTVVILLHAAGVTALALSKMEVIGKTGQPTEVVIVKPDPIPPRLRRRRWRPEARRPIRRSICEAGRADHPARAGGASRPEEGGGLRPGPPPRADEPPVEAYRPPPPFADAQAAAGRSRRCAPKRVALGRPQPPTLLRREEEREGKVTIRVTSERTAG